jgi:hypothetical protein
VREALWSEWGKTWSVRAPWMCLLLTGALTVVTASSLANDFVLSTGDGELPSGARMPVVDALGPALQVGQLALAAFALQLITAEYATGSVRTTLLAQPRRSRLLLTKALVAGSCGAALGAGLGVCCAVLVRVVLGDHLGESGTLPGDAARTGALLALVAVLAVGVGAALRSAVGTLSAVAVLLVGTLVVPERLGRWTPGPASAALLGDGGWGAVIGLLVLAAWAAAALAVGALAMERRDA